MWLAAVLYEHSTRRLSHCLTCQRLLNGHSRLCVGKQAQWVCSPVCEQRYPHKYWSIIVSGTLPQETTTKFCFATSTRDLGVVVNNNLTPCSHIASIVITANQRSNLIFRSFTSRDVHLLVRLLPHTFGLFWNITQLFGRHTTKAISSVSRRSSGVIMIDYMIEADWSVQRMAWSSQQGPGETLTDQNKDSVMAEPLRTGPAYGAPRARPKYQHATPLIISKRKQQCQAPIMPIINIAKLTTFMYSLRHQVRIVWYKSTANKPCNLRELS